MLVALITATEHTIANLMHFLQPYSFPSYYNNFIVSFNTYLSTFFVFLLNNIKPLCFDCFVADSVSVLRVAIFQVCRALCDVSSSDSLWRRLYTKHFVVISSEIHSVAEDIGWKKAFLVNRLKLQAVKARSRVNIKQQGEDSNKTANEERKKLTLVM